MPRQAPTFSSDTSVGAAPNYGAYAPQEYREPEPDPEQRGRYAPPYRATQPAAWDGSNGVLDGPPRTVTTSLTGLWATGVVMLAIAYTYSIVVASIYVGSNYWGPQNSWVMYLPIVGGFLWPAMDGPYNGHGEFLGIPGASVQTLGLLFIVIGAAIQRTVQVPTAQVSLEPELVAGPGELGAGLRWAF